MDVLKQVEQEEKLQKRDIISFTLSKYVYIALKICLC